MRALLFWFFVFGFFQISAPSAFAEPLDSTSERSLKRLNEVAEQVRLAYCEPDKRRAFEGAIKGINAMPGRKDAAQLVLSTPDFDGFSKAYQEVLQTKIARLELDKAVLNGMAQVFDASNEFVIQRETPSGMRAGILVQFKVDSSGLVIVHPIPDGPAAVAGLLAGDRLKAIDGKPLTGLSMEEIANKLRGASESEVAVTISRAGIEKTFSMQRSETNSFSQVRYQVVDGIGVITVLSFQQETGTEVRDAIRAMRQDIRKPKGFIVDLRYNGGGWLDGVIGLVDQFASRGLIVVDQPAIKCSTNLPQSIYAKPNDESKGVPVVVLVNKETESGAELAAAALRDIRHAKIVGQPTAGVAHSFIAIGNIPMGSELGFLRLRMGTYLPFSGKSFEGTGIVPDVLVETGDPRGDAAMEQAIQLLNAPRNQKPR